MSSFDVIETTLASAVADAGTFTVGYPTGKTPGHYQGGKDHRVNSFGYGELRALDGEVSMSFDAAVVTITNNSGVSLAAGTKLWVQLDIMGADEEQTVADPETMVPATLMTINLGAPDAADADGAVASQACTAASGLATGINGALASGGVATFDVPRAAVAAWTGTAVLTITGTDYYGNTVVESSASGTSLTGKKAFKTITAVTTSADITGLTVGTGDVIGLPVFLPQTGMVLREMEDGAAPTAGTLVAGVTTTATATTGDVRGTYDPNSACDGAKAFQLVIAVPDPAFKGVAQYAG
jgi:hypothetical protein